MPFSNQRGHPRQIRHEEIRQLVVRGQLEESLLHFQEALQEFGPHVGLLCDFAGVYYELGRFREFSQIVSEIELQLKVCRDLLGKDSARRTYLMLGKYYEEMAEPAKAFSCLNLSLEYSESLEEQKWVELQILRLRSYFGQHKGLSGKYLHVLESIRGNTNLHIELQHCLLWTDWALFGYGECEKRFSQSLEMDLNILDRRLMSRDFIEISLLSGVRNSSLLIVAQECLQNGNQLSFDQLLLGLLKDGKVGNDAGVNLSEMMRLRIIQLAFRTEQNSARRDELSRKYLFLIDHLSRDSKDLFQRLLPKDSDQKIKTLTVNPAQKILRINNENMIKLTATQIKFILTCQNTSQVSLDEVSHKIWNSPADESIYHRVRMLVYRLEGELNLRLGLPAFEVKKDRVVIHPLLKITSE